MKSQSKNPLWLRHLPESIRRLFEDGAGLLAAIHNFGWIFSEKMMRGLFGVLVGAWVARYLGPSEFGELSYAIAFITIFQAIANLGLDGIVVREVVNNIGRANIVLGTAFRLRLFAGVACWVLAFVIYGLNNGFEGQGVWIVGLIGAGMIFQVADTVDLWFQGNSQSKRTVLAKTSAYLVSNGIRVALILLGAPLIAFAAIVAIEAALIALALYISYRRFPCIGFWQKNHLEAKKLLWESWPHMLAGLSIMVYMRIDQLMIKNLLGEHALGIYASIIPISNLWNMLPVAICASFAPMMAKKRSEGIDVFNASLARMFRIFWALCSLIIVATLLLSGLVIKLMYGDAYVDSIPVLNIYVFTCIPVFMGVGQSLWILNERKPYLYPMQTISGAVVSVLANLILLPLWGINGGAVAAVIAQITSCFLINGIFVRRLFLMQIGFIGRKIKA